MLEQTTLPVFCTLRELLRLQELCSGNWGPILHTTHTHMPILQRERKRICILLFRAGKQRQHRSLSFRTRVYTHSRSSSKLDEQICSQFDRTAQTPAFKEKRVLVLSFEILGFLPIQPVLDSLGHQNIYQTLLCMPESFQFIFEGIALLSWLTLHSHPTPALGLFPTNVAQSKAQKKSSFPGNASCISHDHWFVNS